MAPTVVPIVNGATAYDCERSGQTYILVVNEALYYGYKNWLLPSTQKAQSYTSDPALQQIKNYKLALMLTSQAKHHGIHQKKIQPEKMKGTQGRMTMTCMCWIQFSIADDGGESTKHRYLTQGRQMYEQGRPSNQAIVTQEYHPRFWQKD